MTTKTVAIVGGGFAGLTAAYYLRKAGWAPTILEASDRVGGRVATVYRDGYTLDTGATQISTGYKEYVALSKALGLDTEIIDSSCYIGVLRRKKIHMIDGSSMLSGPLSSLLGIGSKVAMTKTILDYLALKPRMDVLDVSNCAAYDTESSLQYAQRRLNREIYDALIDPMIRAYVINRADNVSCLEWFSSIGNLGGQQMTSIKGGNVRMPQALAEHAEVRLNSSVRSLVHAEKSLELTYQCSQSGLQTLVADACVVATRIPETLQIYPPFAQIAGALASRLTYNRGLVVQLGFKRRPGNKAIGILIPTVEHNEIGLVWLEHNKNPDRVPDGHSLYSVYFDDAVCDAYFNRDDEALVGFCTNFMTNLFPELEGTLDLSLVTRWPMAVPNPATGIYALVAEMKQRIDPASNVQFAGDYFTCTGQNSAIYWGRKAAENLIRHQQ